MIDRADIYNDLTLAMKHAGTTAADGRLSPGRIKSRVLEAHPPSRDPDGVSALLRSTASRSGLAAEEIAEDIWAIRDDRRLSLLDTFDPRFWLLHSTASSQQVDRLLRQAFLSDAHFDTAWMPPDMLDRFGGRRQLVSASFTTDALTNAGTMGPGENRRLRVRLEGEAPDDLLDLIRSNERFAAAAPLGSVGSTFSESALGSAMVVVDYRGRFVSSGTSFEVAAGAIWEAVARYRSWIASIEDQYRLTPTHDGAESGFGLRGSVAILELQSPIASMERFLAGLFSCREPFRLWAVPRQTAEDFYEANAVDLHVGQPLRLEISSTEIRVLLRAATCGNTLARLLVNLQHHLDARLELSGAELTATA